MCRPINWSQHVGNRLRRPASNRDSNAGASRSRSNNDCAHRRDDPRDVAVNDRAVQWAGGAVLLVVGGVPGTKSHCDQQHPCRNAPGNCSTMAHNGLYLVVRERLQFQWPPAPSSAPPGLRDHNAGFHGFRSSKIRSSTRGYVLPAAPRLKRLGVMLNELHDVAAPKTAGSGKLGIQRW